MEGNFLLLENEATVHNINLTFGNKFFAILKDKQIVNTVAFSNIEYVTAVIDGN